MNGEMQRCSYGCDRERLWREFENVSRKLDGLTAPKQIAFQTNNDSAFAQAFMEMVRRGDIGLGQVA